MLLYELLRASGATSSQSFPSVSMTRLQELVPLWPPRPTHKEIVLLLLFLCLSHRMDIFPDCRGGEQPQITHTDAKLTTVTLCAPDAKFILVILIVGIR